MLDEVDRALHDALCIVRRVLESHSVVPGGGAVEAALSVFLDNYASALGSREQLAINEYADALLVIPKTLAVNAAKDATDLVAKLCALHSLAQTSDEKKYLSTVRACLPALAACRVHAASAAARTASPRACADSLVSLASLHCCLQPSRYLWCCAVGLGSGDRCTLQQRQEWRTGADNEQSQAFTVCDRGCPNDSTH
jgi:hypothetical protein